MVLFVWLFMVVDDVCGVAKNRRETRHLKRMVTFEEIGIAEGV